MRQPLTNSPMNIESSTLKTAHNTTHNPDYSSSGIRGQYVRVEGDYAKLRRGLYIVLHVNGGEFLVKVRKELGTFPTHQPPGLDAQKLPWIMLVEPGPDVSKMEKGMHFTLVVGGSHFMVQVGKILRPPNKQPESITINTWDLGKDISDTASIITEVAPLTDLTSHLPVISPAVGNSLGLLTPQTFEIRNRRLPQDHSPVNPSPLGKATYGSSRGHGSRSLENDQDMFPPSTAVPSKSNLPVVADKVQEPNTPPSYCFYTPALETPAPVEILVPDSPDSIRFHINPVLNPSQDAPVIFSPVPSRSRDIKRVSLAVSSSKRSSRTTSMSGSVQDSELAQYDAPPVALRPSSCSDIYASSIRSDIAVLGVPEPVSDDSHASRGTYEQSRASFQTPTHDTHPNTSATPYAIAGGAMLPVRTRRMPTNRMRYPPQQPLQDVHAAYGSAVTGSGKEFASFYGYVPPMCYGGERKSYQEDVPCMHHRQERRLGSCHVPVYPIQHEHAARPFDRYLQPVPGAFEGRGLVCDCQIPHMGCVESSTGGGRLMDYEEEEESWTTDGGRQHEDSDPLPRDSHLAPVPPVAQSRVRTRTTAPQVRGADSRRGRKKTGKNKAARFDKDLPPLPAPTKAMPTLEVEPEPITLSGRHHTKSVRRKYLDKWVNSVHRPLFGSRNFG